MVLAPIDGAASRELDEARLMGRALFEATWGSYLRQQAQPGFDLNLLPQVYAHVTSFVRGGGPLPVIRLGRQPYAVAPVMARGTWAPVAESAFEQWLANFLPGIRPLWTSGFANVPSGPDLFAFEPVSTHVRLRTTNMSAAVDYMVAMKNAVVMLGLPSLHTGHWDPSTRACAETGTVVNLHIGSSSTSPSTSDDAPPDVTGVLFFGYAMFAAVDWLYSKLPVRYPELKISLSEGGIGWVPALVDRLNHMLSYHEMYGTWTGID